MHTKTGSGLRVPSQQLSSFTFSNVPAMREVPVARKSVLKTCAPGPWGEIEFHYLYLEASAELVESFKMPSATSRWTFPGCNRESLRSILNQAGVADVVVNRWAFEHSLEQEGVIHILPQQSELEALTSVQRADRKSVV